MNGSVSFAVVSVAVPNWAITIIAASPRAGRMVHGRLNRLILSTSSESPAAVTSSPRGATNQQRIRSTGAASYVPESWLGSGRWRERQMH